MTGIELRRSPPASQGHCRGPSAEGKAQGSRVPGHLNRQPSQSTTSQAELSAGKDPAPGLSTWLRSELWPCGPAGCPATMNVGAEPLAQCGGLWSHPTGSHTVRTLWHQAGALTPLRPLACEVVPIPGGDRGSEGQADPGLSCPALWRPGALAVAWSPGSQGPGRL